MYTIKLGQTVLTSGRVKMEPCVNSYVKQCFIRTPYLFKDRPVVTVTVSTEKGNDSFVVYGVEQSKANGETIFKVSATNNEIGKESADKYWCDFTIMGELP